MRIGIDKEIFEKWPDLKIGVIVGFGLNNTEAKKKSLELLKGEEANQQKELSLDDLKKKDFVKAWRKVYQEFGASSKKYKSSIEALLTRVLSEKELPNINPLVNFYNYLSLKYHLPFGGEDLDKVKGDISLSFAKGDEKGKYIGSGKIEAALPGEVIYQDELGFICRCFNWREADRTKLTSNTKNVVLVAECLLSSQEDSFKKAIRELKGLVEKELGGKARVVVLDKNSPELEVDFNPGSKLTKKDEVSKKVGAKAKSGVVDKEVKKKTLFTPLPKWLPEEQIREVLYLASQKAESGLIKKEEIEVKHPGVEEHGDFSSNLGLVLAKKLGKKPIAVAEQLAREINSQSSELIEKVEIAGPGFINFYLSSDYLLLQAKWIGNEKEVKEKLGVLLRGKKYLLEHTSPDPIKTLHIGHLRNNFLGMANFRLMELLGAKVTLDCIDNDRGVHISRAMWGYLVFGEKDLGLANYPERVKKYKVNDGEVKQIALQKNWKELLKGWLAKPENWYQPKDFKLSSDKFDNAFYSLGQRAEDLVEGVGEQVREILRSWESEEKGVRKLWRTVINWSHQGYELTYKRIGSHHDKVWHESDHYRLGKEWVKKGLEKGIFKKLEEGAVLSNLEKYGLSDAILIKSDGTALYHTQDLQLTYQKMNQYPSDLYIWDIGNDQLLYLEQLFAICEQLGIGRREKFFHLNYGFITLKGGARMSSRYGGVVNGDDLLDFLKKEALKIISQSDSELRGKMTPLQKEKLAEAVALSACKYGFLKFSKNRNFAFDFQASLSVEGDSGPYLQYTYTRCFSVLKKAKVKGNDFSLKCHKLEKEELALLRAFYQLPEVLIEALNSFDPHFVCQYLLKLAQKYNLFYQKHRIINSKGQERELRLFLTKVTAQILKMGLEILGITVLEKM